MDAKIPRSYTNTIEDDCVSVEKVSDAGNMFGHAFQGTGTPDLQEPLIPPDDDHIHVSATISLTLPHELVERILLLLDTKSVLRSRLVNRDFNALIQSSTLVQYYLACKAAGVIDNPQSSLSYGERFEALKKREDAWKNLKPVFETSIKDLDQLSTLYEFTEGNYFRTDNNWNYLYYCHLPSSQENPQWLRIPGHGPGQRVSGSIVEFGVAVYEHDLVVNMISSPVENQAGRQQYSLDLVLLKFSTGEYHPIARCQLIHVQRSPSAKPYTLIRIMGDNLIVHDEDGSKLFIFDWKTGHKRLQHKSTESAYDYSGLLFVSPELLLVPNRLLYRLEVWHLYPSSSHPNTKSPIQILSLQIPVVSSIYTITRIDCDGGRGPFLYSMPHFPPRPFFSSSEDSVITVKLLFRSFLLGPQFRREYKLIMHRRALLDMIQKWTSPSLLEQQEGLCTWLINEVTVYKIADADDGSVRLRAQSALVSPICYPRTHDSSTISNFQVSPTSTLHVSADSISSSISSGSASSTSRYHIFQVQWADWGPSISRWFQVKGDHTWLINQSIGQRSVFLNPNPLDKTKCMIDVADFNLHNVRRNAQMTAKLRRKQVEDNGGGSGNNEQGKKEENDEDTEILDHEGLFAEKVYMGLKCVIYHVPDEYDFDAVMMDEERLLGLKLDIANRTKSIKVLYIG